MHNLFSGNNKNKWKCYAAEILTGILIITNTGCTSITDAFRNGFKKGYESVGNSTTEAEESSNDADDGIYISGDEKKNGSDDLSKSGAASDSDAVKALPGYVESKNFYSYKFADSDNKDFESYLDDYFKDTVTSDTLSYNFSVKDGSKYGVKAPDATLGDASMNAESVDKQKNDDYDKYKELTAFENKKLTKDERWTYLNLKEDMEADLMIYNNIYFYEPFSPMRGLQSNIPTNFTDYRFDDKSDIEDYIALLGQLKDYFGKYLDFEREKSEKGYFMSEANAEDVIDQCNTFVKDPENNFMISVFDSRIDKLDFLTDSEKEKYKKKDKTVILDSVIPAFQDVADTFTELKSTGKAGGIYNLDGGKDYYEDYILPKFEGSDKSASEVMDMLEDEEQSAISDMRSVYQQNPEAYQYFSDNYSKLFSKTDSEEPKEIIDYLMNNAMSEFPKINNIPYTVNYLDKSMESIMENTLAYYMSPAIDDEKSNIIYVNGAHTSGMWTTLAHEGCPGHMYQNAYFQSTKPNKVRAIAGNLGYQEGWAVYSSYETLSDYDFGDGKGYSDELAKLSRDNEDLGYVFYGILDIGVNYEGWSVDKCKSYMKNMGFGTDGVEDMYNTVIGDPGAYLSYSASYCEYKNLREDAENELGSKFKAVDFNKVILDAGPCQFKLLEEQIDNYIDENK